MPIIAMPLPPPAALFKPKSQSRIWLGACLAGGAAGAAGFYATQQDSPGWLLAWGLLVTVSVLHWRTRGATSLTAVGVMFQLVLATVCMLAGWGVCWLGADIGSP